MEKLAPGQSVLIKNKSPLSRMENLVIVSMHLPYLCNSFVRPVEIPIMLFNSNLGMWQNLLGLGLAGLGSPGK